mgnify:CR=1 FL=1
MVPPGLTATPRLFIPPTRFSTMSMRPTPCRPAWMMPPGQPWRTGSDEATIISATKPIRIGTLTLAANTPHTINTVPGASWELIIGRLEKPGQWGIPYNKALEVGRAPMTAGKTKAPVEQVTIHIDDTAAGATLRIEWGGASATAPFTVG